MNIAAISDAMRMLLAADQLAHAVAAYFRAIDGEGDPKAIRRAVENLRAAHGRYEAAKGGTA